MKSLSAWKGHFGEQLKSTSSIIEFGILLNDMMEAFPGRLGSFVQQFHLHTVPYTGQGSRFRDVLPLALFGLHLLDLLIILILDMLA